jgi:exonuclease III
MIIITWNCNGALRNKFGYLNDFDADIVVIQECENPTETKHVAYKNWAENHLWIGDNKSKGLGIFAKKNIKIKRLNWSNKYENHSVKYFLPCMVNDDFNLLAVWNHRNNSPTFGYIGQLWKYLQINKSNLHECLILGDFNSNKIWDKWDRWWNHTDVVAELNEMGIQSLYHSYHNESQGSETQATFFLHKNIEKPYHIDYIFGSSKYNSSLKKMTFGDVHDCLKLSDHLPIICVF